MIPRLSLGALALSICLGSSECQAQQCPPVWSQPYPSTIGGGAAAFDSDRGVVVLRGYYDGAALSRTTWEGDGDTWTAVSDSGPGPRWGFAMAYDSDRHRMVLFGGYLGGPNGTRSNETWEWDGENWTLRSTTGPSPRYRTAMAYDPNLRCVILHGGNVRDAQTPMTVTTSDDTWTWDGNTWRLVIPNSGGLGTGRQAHSMTFDPLLNSVVMYGGSDSDTNLRRFTGTEWVVVTAGPGVAYYAPVVFDSQRGRLILCKGGTFHWEWDGQTWTNIPPSGPSLRDQSILVYDSWRRRTLSFGGYSSNGSCNDFWAWDGTSWTVLRPVSPPARFATAMVYDSLRDTFVLFGGIGALNPQGFLADTWELHADRWSLASSGGPPARGYHSLGFDSDRGRTVLYGGLSSSNSYLADTWEWDGATWVQIQTTGPSARWRAPVAYDPTRHKLVLFGGGPADTWEYDASGWRQLNPTVHPTARIGSAMTFYPPLQRVVLFGGSGELPPYYSDLWSWNGSTWTQLSFAAGPPGRRSAGMVFDPVRNVLVLACGAGPDAVLDDVWEWNGHTWSQATSTAGPRCLFGLAFDLSRGQCRLFGGAVGTGSQVTRVCRDEWAYSSPTPPFATRDPLDARVCPDYPLSLSAQFSGSTPMSVQWLRDGVAIAGANSRTLTIAQPSAADAGTYICAASNACTTVSSGAATVTFAALCCGTADFDADGSTGTDADIQAFFACLAGSCCPTCGSTDFDGDGDFATDADIEAFFRVLAGGSC